MLVSSVWQSDSVFYIYINIYIFFFRFLSIISYCKVLIYVNFQNMKSYDKKKKPQRPTLPLTPEAENLNMKTGSLSPHGPGSPSLPPRGHKPLL